VRQNPGDKESAGWHTIAQVAFVLGTPLTAAIQMLKNWQSPPFASKGAALQASAQLSIMNSSAGTIVKPWLTGN
jgi:hypothetical protein